MSVNCYKCNKEIPNPRVKCKECTHRDLLKIVNLPSVRPIIEEEVMRRMGEQRKEEYK